MSQTKKNTEMNAKMARVIPELASSYATYPMAHSRWLKPHESGPKGEPCFLSKPADGSREMKMDYVYGKGPHGEGYYHMLTHEAYVNLYSRINNEVPSCCACSKEARKAYDEYDDVKRLLYNRWHGKVPNDVSAARDGMDAAKDQADMMYNATQLEQTAIYAARLGNAL